MRLPQRVADQVRLLVGREGDVDDLDLWVLDQLLGRVVDAPDAPALGDLGRLGGVREAIATTGKPASV